MKRIRYFLMTIGLMVSLSHALCQTLTQSLRGRVVDQAAQTPLVGVNVMVTDVQPVAVGVSDSAGFFRIERVPLGRHTVLCSYVGYKEQTVGNVLITTGKETELNIELSEQIGTLNEVVVRSSGQRTSVEKGLSTVSGQVFDIEQTRRFAGSRNDPARMVASLAGVQGNNDSRNDIIVRGNSPTGVLWRLEGVDIFNPSHFGELGATGGPVSMINNSLLAKSSFLTGAFPAIYGNATGGVFDLQLRTGNTARREYIGQLGINGLEFGAEGPFVKGGRASYVASYRYSALGLASRLGISFGTGSGVPSYQDLSVKVNLPTSRLGTFSLFVLGGNSSIQFRNDKTTNNYNAANQNLDYATSMGVVGLSNSHRFTPNTTGKLTVAWSRSSANMVADNIRLTNEGSRIIVPNYRDKSQQHRTTLVYTLNHKASARSSFVTGVTANWLGVNYNDSLFSDSLFKPLRAVQGQTMLMQAYGNWHYRPSERLTLNAGLFGQYLALNQSHALEPRLGLKYQLNETQAVSVGVGRHSQLQSLPVYFTQPLPTDRQTNRQLDFTRSEQVVVGYQRTLGTQTTIRLEAYYQYLHNVPVEQTSSAYSALNLGAAYEVSTQTNLVNEGTGYNKGIELTLERTFDKHFYYLLTGSLYDSRYRGSDGQLRTTAFAGRYALNALAGYELPMGNRYVLTLDGRLSMAGGRRYTPIDLAASEQKNQEVLVDREAYSRQHPGYLRADLKLSLRRNGNRFMHEWAVDIQNITNHRNLFRYAYDPASKTVNVVYQLGFYPMINYRIQF
jgi:hypothetical protein